MPTTLLPPTPHHHVRSRQEARPPLAVTQVATSESPLLRLLPVLLALIGLMALVFFVPKTAQNPEIQARDRAAQNQALVQEIHGNPASLSQPTQVARLVAPDFQYHLTDGNVTYHSSVGRNDLFTAFWRGYSYRSHILKSIIPVGETVTTRWTTSYVDYTSPEGEVASFSGTTIWRIADEKIAEVWIILD